MTHFMTFFMFFVIFVPQFTEVLAVNYLTSSPPKAVWRYHPVCLRTSSFREIYFSELFWNAFGSFWERFRYILVVFSVSLRNVFGTSAAHFGNFFDTLSAHFGNIFSTFWEHVWYAFVICSEHLRSVFGMFSGRFRYVFGMLHLFVEIRNFYENLAF